MKNNAKLWQTGDVMHPLVEAYTVGQDYLLDQRLVPYDITASQAHAKMLAKMNVLTETDLEEVTQALDTLRKKWETSEFVITQDQEDCHTAIEQYLTLACGELGKKIHTGRSRNDQALVMLRLFEKDQLDMISKQLTAASTVLKAASEKYATQPMPGYTHTQRAMPTTVGMWLGAYADAFADCKIGVSAVRQLIDQNPLGSASGFGLQTFPLDREVTTSALGFAKVQDNPMYCGLSRGLFETQLLHALDMPVLLASRFAADMLLFTTEEYGFVSLPHAYTTGSSIMPNKQNYDLFEIMRANAAVFSGYQQQLQQIVGGLSSGYSRDLQLTKPPLIQGCDLVDSTLVLLTEVIPHLGINTGRLDQAMSTELFATDRVYEHVQQGLAFRDAYRIVKQEINEQSSSRE